MKCLSLTHPLGPAQDERGQAVRDLRVEGALTRPLAIHASSSLLSVAMSLCHKEPFKSALQAAGDALDAAARSAVQ